MLYLPKPKSCHLQWHITEKCNFSCTHCYLNEDYIRQELSTKECFEVVDNFIDFCKKTDIKNHRNITLSGGEPILKKDWWKILEYISRFKKEGLIDRFGIMTNGSTVTNNIIQRYKELGVDYMQISVEGMEEINDEIRGKGNFKKAINGAKIIKFHNIPLSFSLTLTRKNLKDVESLARLAASMGVDGFGTGRIVPIGMGEQMKDLMLTPKETKNWYIEAEKINQRLKQDNIKIKVDFHCSDGMYQGLRPEVYNPQTNHGCSTPFDVFTLLPNGDIVPCRRLPIVVGNIREQSFLEIHYSSNKIWNLKNWNNRTEECKTCESVDACKGGGMCIAYGYFNTPFAPDPGCWKVFGNDLSNKKYKQNNNSEQISYFKRYINNLRTDLESISKEEYKKKRKLILIKNLKKEKIANNDIIIFDLKEEDLNPKTGIEILEFLNKNSQENFKTKIGHSLPPCIFDSKTKKKFTFDYPSKCFDCTNLFEIEDNNIIFCNKRKGPELKFMNNKEQIWEYMELLKDYDKADEFKKCKSCIHKMRGTCFYIKNCKLVPKKKTNKLAIKATNCGC